MCASLFCLFSSLALVSAHAHAHGRSAALRLGRHGAGEPCGQRQLGHAHALLQERLPGQRKGGSRACVHACVRTFSPVAPSLACGSLWAGARLVTLQKRPFRRGLSPVGLTHRFNLLSPRCRWSRCVHALHFMHGCDSRWVLAHAFAKRAQVRNQTVGSDWASFDGALDATQPGNGGESGVFWLEPEITPTVNGKGQVLFDAAGHKSDALASPAATLRACIESQVGTPVRLLALDVHACVRAPLPLSTVCPLDPFCRLLRVACLLPASNTHAYACDGCACTRRSSTCGTTAACWGWTGPNGLWLPVARPRTSTSCRW